MDRYRKQTFSKALQAFCFVCSSLLSETVSIVPVSPFALFSQGIQMTHLVTVASALSQVTVSWKGSSLNNCCHGDS